MPTPRDDEKFSPVSFAPHVARGLIRNQTTRRRVMAATLLVAVAMVILGATLLREALSPRVHVVFFLLFWLACAWLTLTAVLLAVFDVLMVRAEARAVKKAFRDGVMAGTSQSPERSAGDRAHR